MAGAASATFAWQAQHFDSLGVACARLVAAGDRLAQYFVHLALLLRGRRSTLTLWELPVRVWSPRGTGYFCVAGAALCASSATFAWQVQHFDSLGVACARLVAGGDRLLLPGRRSTFCI